jgi:hypothetical protein
MDGRNAAAHFLTNPSQAPAPTAAAASAAAAAALGWRTDLLVEYYGLGDVVRYEHLEDTQNNTYRAVRRLDPSRPRGERNLKLAEFTSWENWE